MKKRLTQEEYEEIKANIVYRLDHEEVLDKKQVSWELNIDERVFRRIISELAVSGVPILSLSNSLGYKKAKVSTSLEKNKETCDMVEHQIREIESRIRVLNQRKKALVEFKNKVDY